MDEEKKQICKSLIEWFKVLNLPTPHSNAEELSDGVAFAQALNQICGETFTDNWLSKIKFAAGSNWRLKMSNLKKVIEGLYDYYTDVLNLNLNDFSRPDAMKIAEHCDMNETGRLLQLILGCAVNCSDKQNYITQIMDLEESLQQTIMKALQDLESIWQGPTSSRNSLSIINFDVKILQDERDAFAQKCYEVEKQVALLSEEKSAMQSEISKLQNEIEKLENPTAIGDDGVSLGPVQIGSNRYNDLRKQLDRLKEELLQSETAREDIKIKSIQQDQEIKSLKQKLEDYVHNNSELSQLKDEVDVLREASDKLKACETQIATYKKKLEDHNDLKRQIKMLEDRNAEYLRQNSQYEEDSKKLISMKGQVELFKKEIQELHSKLDSEMSKNVQLEFDKKNLESSLTASQRTKETLINERDALRETMDELRLNRTSNESEYDNNVSREMQAPELKEKIERLEMENKALREGQGGQTALAQLLDEANKRCENFRDQLKISNERILLLNQASLDEKKKHTTSDENQEKGNQIEDITNLQAEINHLKSSLATRDQELIAYDIRYRKCVEKAKEVIKGLDPRISSVIESNFDKPNDENEVKQRMSEMEEKLIASAFYRFGVNAQREALEAKLALLMGQGYSFLARHRQLTPRKSNLGN